MIKQISLVCGVMLVVFAACSGRAEVIWRGDFETGNTDQWKGGAPREEGVKKLATIVTDVVREGKYAVRIDGTNAAIRKGNDRVEFLHQPDPAGCAEGTERFFCWSLYAPKTLKGFHSGGYFEARKIWRQTMAFELNGDDVQFSTRVPYALRWQGKGKFTPGHWHDFIVHVGWSRDPAKGFVEVWYDGEKVVPKTSTATLHDDNVCFLQVGFFRRSADFPETIYLDHVLEATTLEDVMLPPAGQNTKK